MKHFVKQRQENFFNVRIKSSGGEFIGGSDAVRNLNFRHDFGATTVPPLLKRAARGLFDYASFDFVDLEI